jgi:rare lipoprotein A
MLHSQNKSPEAGELCVKPQWRNATSVKGSLVLCFFLLTFPALAFPETGTASWYSSKDACKYNPTKGCPTSSGISIYELERTKQDFAAAWNYPMGSLIKITNLRNGKSVVCVVRDRGPAKRLFRLADLSRQSFSKISSLKEGVIKVKVEKVNRDRSLSVKSVPMVHPSPSLSSFEEASNRSGTKNRKPFIETSLPHKDGMRSYRLSSAPRKRL